MPAQYDDPEALNRKRDSNKALVVLVQRSPAACEWRSQVEPVPDQMRGNQEQSAFSRLSKVQ